MVSLCAALSSRTTPLYVRHMLTLRRCSATIASSTLVPVSHPTQRMSKTCYNDDSTVPTLPRPASAPSSASPLRCMFYICSTYAEQDRHRICSLWPLALRRLRQRPWVSVFDVENKLCILLNISAGMADTAPSVPSFVLSLTALLNSPTYVQHMLY